MIYQRCLAIELERVGVSFIREQEHTIYYEGIDVGTRRADFIIENTVVVELKALINLEDVHLAQAKNYVVAYDKPLGLLINFGSTSLQFKKVFNPKYNNRLNQDLQDLMMNKIESKILKSNNPINPDSDK